MKNLILLLISMLALPTPSFAKLISRQKLLEATFEAIQEINPDQQLHFGPYPIDSKALQVKQIQSSKEMDSSEGVYHLRGNVSDEHRWKYRFEIAVHVIELETNSYSLYLQEKPDTLILTSIDPTHPDLVLNFLPYRNLNLNWTEAPSFFRRLLTSAKEAEPLAGRAYSFKIRGHLGSTAPTHLGEGVSIQTYAPLNLHWSGTTPVFYDDALNAAEGRNGLPSIGQVIYLSADDVRNMSFEDLKNKLIGNKNVSQDVIEQINLTQTNPQVLPVAHTAQDFSNAAITAAYLKIVLQTNRVGLENALSGLKNQLTTSEKIALVRVVGYEGNLHYDFQRANQPHPTGTPTYIEYGTPLPYDKNISSQYGNAIPYEQILFNFTTTNRLGVCRDIVPAQSQLLSQLGFKNVFIIGFNEGANHAAVIAQDPDHPDQLLEFNYYQLATKKLNQGMGALTRNQDFTTVYNVYNAEGKSVANLPSELGALMMEAAGGNPETIDPLLKNPQGSIISTSLDTAHDKIPLYIAQTPDGSVLAGVGYTYIHGNPIEDLFSFSGTTSLALQHKKTLDFNNQTVTYDVGHAMYVANAQLATPWWNASKKSPLQVRATVTGLTQRDYTKEGLKSGGEEGSSAADNTEVGIEVRYAGNKTTWRARVATQQGYGNSNISDSNSSQIYTNISYFDLKGETVILPNKLKATLDAAVAYRVFGPQVFIKAGVYDPNGKWAASGGIQGSIQKDAFTIAPGSERGIFAEYQRKISTGILLTASYFQTIDFSAQGRQIQIGAQGSITQLLKKNK